MKDSSPSTKIAPIRLCVKLLVLSARFNDILTVSNNLLYIGMSNWEARIGAVDLNAATSRIEAMRIEMSRSLTIQRRGLSR